MQAGRHRAPDLWERRGWNAKAELKAYVTHTHTHKKKFLESLAFQSIKTRFHYLEIIYIMNGIIGTWRQWVSWGQENKIPGYSLPVTSWSY